MLSLPTIMKRPPNGVLVIAIIDVVFAIAKVVQIAHFPEDFGFPWIAVIFLLFNIVCTAGLVMLQNWARRASLVLWVLSLNGVAQFMSDLRLMADSPALAAKVPTWKVEFNVVWSICCVFLVVWIVWYLCQRHVRDAFRKAPSQS